jgi:hypothetical protein
MAEDRDGGDINYVKEALTWQYNWIAMAGAVGFSILSGTAFPLMLGAGLELIYLSIVPQNSRFQRLVRSWKYDEERRKRQMSLMALFNELPPEMKLRYSKVDSVTKAIRANYKRLTSTSQMFAEQMETKLDGLSQSYIRLLNSAFHHREYLQSTDLQSIRSESAQLQKDMAKQAAKVQEINKKRVEILQKRAEKFEKIKENCQVIDAQCGAVEDVLQLIRDQSVTMRDPQEISDHLDSLVKDVEQTEETVREVESIFDLSPLATAEMEANPAARTRIRN